MMVSTLFKYCTCFLFLFTISVPLKGQVVTYPDPPVFNYLTYDTANNHLYADWFRSSSANVMEYDLIIYHENNEYEILETIHGADNTSWTGMIPGIFENPAILALRSVDSANTRGERFSPRHNTLLPEIDYDTCSLQAIISWNHYIGWDESLISYNIFMKTGSGQYIKEGEITADQNNFIAREIEPDTNYCILIEATRSDSVTAFSVPVCFYSEVDDAPSVLQINNTSVNAENLVELEIEIDGNSDINTYYLFRKTADDKDWSVVDTLFFPDPGRFFVSDAGASAFTSNFFKMGAVNSCNAIIKESNMGSNIALQADYDGTNVFLAWNSYHGWPDGVEKHVVRRVTEDGRDEEIAILPAGDTVYTDNLTSLFNKEIAGHICYYIETFEHGGVNSAVSYSPEICVNLTGEFLLPNAFTPNDDGRNDVFRPVFSFLPEQYTMYIYDRWGNTVFETSDPGIGWNGTYHNKPVPSGVYIYYMIYREYNGESKEKKGTVTVIYP